MQALVWWDVPMTQPWWPGPPEQPASAQPAQPWQAPPSAGQPGARTVPVPASPWMPPPVPGQPGSQPTAQVPAGQPTEVRATGDIGAVLPGPPQRPSVPGLGFVTFLLVVAALVFGFFVARDWVADWATAIDPCLDAGGAWECVINDQGREQVLLPVVAIFAALCLARGAGVERSQGRAIGFLYVLLGFGVLVLSWSWGGGFA